MWVNPSAIEFVKGGNYVMSVRWKAAVSPIPQALRR